MKFHRIFSQGVSQYTIFGPMMSRQYTVSQLAKAAEIPTTTVRYYERIGLVEPDDRSQGNYRLYSKESLSKLKFIRAAQAIGWLYLGSRKSLA